MSKIKNSDVDTTVRADGSIESAQPLELKKISANTDIEELEKQIEGILPPEDAEQVLNLLSSVLVSRSFAGPLPPPETLAGYEGVLPGASERILAMAEKSQENQHATDKQLVSNGIHISKAGMYGGLFVSVLLIAGAVVAMFLGYHWVAVAFIGTSALGLVGRLMDGPRKSSSNILENSEDLGDDQKPINNSD